MSIPNKLPCVCTNPNCKFQFYESPSVQISGKSNLVTGHTTKCLRCGFPARFTDFGTDHKGNFYVKPLFNYIRQIKDIDTLIRIKNDLESLNNKTSTNEIAEILSNNDKNFSKLTDAINSIPKNTTGDFIRTLILFIGLCISLLTYLSVNDGQEFEKEKFEYKKKRDSINDAKEKSKKIENIPNKLNKLEINLEKKIKKESKIIEKRKNLPHKKTLKSVKNKLCECGSKKKQDVCHPFGLVFRLKR